MTGRRRQDWVGAPGHTELVWQRGAVDSPGERYTSRRRGMEYAFEANGALRLTEPLASFPSRLLALSVEF